MNAGVLIVVLSVIAKGRDKFRLVGMGWRLELAVVRGIKASEFPVLIRMI